MIINIGFGEQNTTINLIPVHSRKKSRNARLINGEEISREEIKSEAILLKDKINNDNLLGPIINPAIIEKLINDEEIDFEDIGKKIKTQQIILDADNNPVYDFKKFVRVTKKKIVDNEMKEIITEEEFVPTIANINESIPIQITNKLITYQEALKNYVIGNTKYLTHNDGLSFDFLYKIAEYLDKENKLAIVQAFTIINNKKVPTPMILKDSGRPYAFALLQGKINEYGEYLLRLNFVNFPTKNIIEESKITPKNIAEFILKIQFTI